MYTYIYKAAQKYICRKNAFTSCIILMKINWNKKKQLISNLWFFTRQSYSGFPDNFDNMIEVWQ